MQLLVDENVIPAHVSALDSAGYDVRRSDALLDKGVPDEAVLDAARQENRVLVTYDRKDFSDVENHAGVLIATEGMQPRELRAAVDRVRQAYPTLENVVEFLSDWT
jgi:predicted nuclease of predicted toxin-antitoxin system